MALVLDPTVGGPTANTYCSLAEANTYHESHLYADVWTDADDDARNRALATATRLLDSHIEWNTGHAWIPSAGVVGGGVVSQTQALGWPRYGVVGRNGFVIESTVIPPEVKNATAEFARQLLAADRMKDSAVETQGLTKLSVGSVDLEFKNTRAKVVPDAVFYMVQHLGTLIERGAGSIRLSRA